MHSAPSTSSFRRAARATGRALVASAFATALCAAPLAAAPAGYQATAYKQAVAEAALGAEAIATFYRERTYAPLFTADDAAGRERRAALLAALARAEQHGLPDGRYAPADLRAALAGAGASVRSRGRAEVQAARMFLDYARDISSGVLEPGRILSAVKRELPRRDPVALLEGFARADDPAAFLSALAPRSHEYNRLLAAKIELERVLAAGGWGRPVPAVKLEPGADGDVVVALRNRLIAMGYLERTASRRYDAELTRAVQQFQIDHGLTADGIAGATTLRELNVSARARLKQVLVALERERWLNLPEGKGDRHVLVNLTDFSAKIVDHGVVTFETKAIVGDESDGKPTPEFSDRMEYMELNPTWTVPRGILARDYLPRLKRNPGAASYLQLVNSRGQVVSRSSVNFANYSARTFPFNLVQPPGPRNALGTVKFMFPNPHAIYLHDTPDKHLFDRERRTYSSGCIRLNDPHEFAYRLLARQTATPEDDFHSILRTGRRERIQLVEEVPVHLVYRTAFGQAKGRMNYRADIYGRDGRLWQALAREGVSVPDAPRG